MGPAEGGFEFVKEGFEVGNVLVVLFRCSLYSSALISPRRPRLTSRMVGQLFGGAVIGYEDDVEGCFSRHAWADFV